MLSTRRTHLAPIALAAALIACGSDAAPTPEDQVAAHEDSVMLAEAMYDPAAFDTIGWDSAGAALERGAVVYSYSCSKCHGPVGAGDGGLVLRGDTLRPPSFLTPDWRFAADREGLRRQVFTGTASGMPHWGFYGLKYRDIDAVAAYIQERLRADVEPAA
ncbi:MAG TPA: cytochrome c [Longimicrobiales bacterium]|nr:cytochrome c [Longimicrobiales bacterium]